MNLPFLLLLALGELLGLVLNHAPGLLELLVELAPQVFVLVQHSLLHLDIIHQLC